MSTEQRSPGDVSSQVEPEPEPSAGLELEFQSANRRLGSNDHRSHSTPAPSLPTRIERTQLRARIAALERELEASESRRQEIITRYEQILGADDRRSAPDEHAESETQSRGVLRRLFAGWK
ncbi:hypothetical protein ACLI4Z_10225 [Natrialbaceae archaeon A-arb3/5]